MEVCASCHEVDKQVTKCNVRLIHHVSWYRGLTGTCDICGKPVDTTYTCIAYNNYLEKLGNK